MERRLDRLGLYIHIPFCERKCPYCDFNTYAGLNNQFAGLVDALGAEMARWRTPLAGRSIDTIFVGGGTPTVLDAELLERLFAAVHVNFAVAADAEITCEANPGTVDRAKFGVLRSLGVNRLSLGVQSFQPEELGFLGRIHDVDDVYRAVEAARAAGFANINLDFMFGLPGQPLSAWSDTLERALALAPTHLSLYSLIVEENTPLHHWVATGKVAEPDEGEAAAHYEHAQAALAAAGYVHYEVSNWAQRSLDDGEVTPAYAARHNLIYWRNQEYLGIGPGAHSHLRLAGPDDFVQERRWGNRKPVPGYIKRIGDGRPVVDFEETIEPRLSMGETMMLGLRLVREGVEPAAFRARYSAALGDVFAGELARLAEWGLIEETPARVRLTKRGLMVGNQVFMQFLPDETPAG